MQFNINGTSKSDRALHTTHSMQLNQQRKQWLSNKICQAASHVAAEKPPILDVKVDVPSHNGQSQSLLSTATQSKNSPPSSKDLIP